MDNKTILERANAAIRQGDYEGFLSWCTEDTTWTFVGEQTLHGKQAVRQWMAVTYLEPPQFQVDRLIEEGDYVTALGTILGKDANGQPTQFAYCDVWQIREGQLAALQAFVIPLKGE